MIEKPTVLVLGAGASYDYGFPTGRGLLMDVCADILDDRAFSTSGEPNTPLQRSLIGFSLKDILSFAGKLRASNQPSVDEFVADQPHYMMIGKAVIASVILSSEKEGNLERTSDMRWFEYLFQRMTVGHEPKEFTNNNLAVVTFNYDRSFERLLWRSLTSSYPMSNSEHLSLYHSVPIVHVYGSLGDLPFQSAPGISYSAEANASTVRIARDNIRIIERKQNVAQDQAIRNARDLLEDAEKICFLGFGYNPTNLHRLRVDRVWSRVIGSGHEKKMYGTAYGLEDLEITEAKRQIMKGNEVGEDRLVIEKKNCLEMLRTHPILFELSKTMFNLGGEAIAEN